MGNIEHEQIDEAIEDLGSLVSSAGGRGDEALDIVKDMASELESVRQQLKGAVGENERLREAILDVALTPDSDSGTRWKKAQRTLDHPGEQ